MAKLCPFNTFVDASGNPLNGGLIYTYITGTSTPKTTYTDSSALTAHPNPVVLGSNGRKEIWLGTDQAYRFIIKDSSGTQIGSTIDDVLPTTSFASIAGAQNIDVTGYAVVTTGSADLNLTPDTGHVVIDGIQFPNTPGSIGQVLGLSSTTVAAWTNAGVASLDSIPDVSASTPTSGDVLKYNGSAWANAAQSTLSITASQVSDLPTSATNFSNKTGLISQWTNDSSYTTNAAVATASIAFTNKTGNISQWTNDSGYLTSAASAASQAEMEAASVTNVMVTPGRQIYHPGMPKAICRFQLATSGTGNMTLSNNYGVTSVARLGVQTYRVTFSTAFSNTDYFMICTAEQQDGAITTTGMYFEIGGSSKSTTVCDIGWAGLAEATTRYVSFVVYGDQ